MRTPTDTKTSSRSLKLRPRERVTEYVKKFVSEDETGRRRIPPVRYIAGEIQVSVPTVHAVLKELAQEGQIFFRPGVGYFSPNATPREPYKIAFGVSAEFAAHVHGFWSEQVAMGIFRASAENSNQVVLLPLATDPRDEQKVAEELIQEAEIAHGVIIMPSTKSLEVIETYNKKNKPAVHINPPTLLATANFVSSDYFGTGWKIGNTWKQTGRKRVLFLSSGIESSTSPGLLLAGLVNGLGSALGSGIELRCEELADIEESEADSDKRMEEALRLSAWTPEAILSTGDRMALSAYRTCKKANLSIPEDISIIGASGLDLSFSIQPGLTRAQPAFRKLGQKVLEMLLLRIQSNNAHVPGIFLPAAFRGGQTTRASENQLLHIEAAHASS